MCLTKKFKIHVNNIARGYKLDSKHKKTFKQQKNITTKIKNVGKQQFYFHSKS